jgi:phosphatidylethanolamine/phosphatidyl-N-methylethanolamine N-methyltransferase
MSRQESYGSETRATQSRYDRIAPIYDLMEKLIEPRYSDWRERAWSLVQGPEVLELGVGTGKNMPYYPPEVHVTGVDVSGRMLERARRRAQELSVSVTLKQMDAQQLDFADGTFDSAIATFVYCSVPDPIRGLQEMARTTKPGGPIVLVEHVRSADELIGAIMDLVDPLVARLMGPHINRRTVENVQRAGLQLERVEDLGGGGIFKLIVARRRQGDQIESFREPLLKSGGTENA